MSVIEIFKVIGFIIVIIICMNQRLKASSGIVKLIKERIKDAKDKIDLSVIETVLRLKNIALLNILSLITVVSLSLAVWIYFGNLLFTMGFSLYGLTMFFIIDMIVWFLGYMGIKLANKFIN